MKNAIVEAFSIHLKEYTPDQAAAAREFVREQPQKWARLMGAIVSGFQDLPGRAFAPEMVGAAKAVAQVIEKTTPFRASPASNNIWIAEADIPLLEEESGLAIEAERRPYIIFAAVVAETIGFIFAHTSNISAAEIELLSNINNPHLSRLVTLYLIDKVQMLDPGAQRRAELLDHLEQTISNAAVRASTLEELTNTATSREEERLSEFTNFLQRKEEEVDARLKARLELRNIEEPVKLWHTLAGRHRRRYLLGLLGLAALMTGLGALAIYELPDFLSRLGLSNSDGAQAFTTRGAVIIAICVAVIAGIGWVLKIAGRVVTNSLALAEDADLRAALVDAYLRFIASQAIEDKDRTIMLAALFRPLPGHQHEDIEAPTVLSIAKDAISSSRKATP